MKKRFLIKLLFVALFYLNASSQQDVLTGITSKWEQYSKTFPAERLYVHTDKNFYTAGETIWFKIYQLDTAVKRSGISGKVAYVEIIDEHSSPVVQTKIGMEDKGGSGAVDLPLTLHSGYYTLRAYTNWMKNFGASQFFEKKITVINPLKSVEVPDSLPDHGTINLFPEGGNLVNGIPSQVAFKVLDKYGKASFGTGYLLNESNDTVRVFSPYKFGLGSFDFTPELSHTYKVVFVFDDNTIVAKTLPHIYNEGYVMHAEENGEKIKVQVRTTKQAGEIFLIVQNRQVLKAAKRNTIQNGAAEFLMDKSDLGQGISQLTVFDNEKQPVCERLYFIPPSLNTNVKTNASKEYYNTREQVSLTIADASSKPSNLSVAVYQLDSLQSENASNINTYLWLEAELNGSVENPEYYLSGNSPEVKKAADHLMLTHGWRRFNGKAFLNARNDINYAPEVLGQTITCRITDTTGQPAKNVQVFLSIPETTYKLFSASTNDSGIAKINVLDFYGKGEIVLQMKEFQNRFRKQIINPFFDQYTDNRYPPFMISSTSKQLLENYSIGMQSQHIYLADSIQQFVVPDLKDTLPFFGKGLYTYNLDDYTRFITMEEVLREYVREINVGAKGGGNLTFKLLNEDFNVFNVYNILVLVDGIPLFHTDKIFSVDPLKVRKIDIIPRNYFVGNSIFYGLVNFTTYKGIHEDIDIDPDAISLDYEGLQIKREFYSPDYSAEQQRNSRIPDLRSTLFWSPNVSSGKVEFYTGDNKSKYLVVVEGIAAGGQPLRSVTTFEVK